MQATTSSEFRVLDVPVGSSGEFTLLDRTAMEPTIVVGASEDADIEDVVAGLRPGYVVDAMLEWTDGTARFADVTVSSYTLIQYADAVSGLFEAALETMEEARREGLGVTGRPTFRTDGEPNGAVYAFAEQRGERDIFEEIRSGTLPLEPLIDRLESSEGAAMESAGAPVGTTTAGTDDAQPDHEIFVMRPVEHDYVVVYLVERRDSLLADTVRDTYDCQRPTEPLR